MLHPELFVGKYFINVSLCDIDRIMKTGCCKASTQVEDVGPTLYNCVCWIITAGIRPTLETNRAQTEKKQKIGTDVDKYM